MRVRKRNGQYESVSFDKVLSRIEIFCKDLTTIDPHEICQKVCSRIYDGVPTSELDELTAQLCATMITDNPEYGILSSRITISNHHKNTSPSFSETVSILYNAKDVHGKLMPLVSQELYDIVQANKEKLNSVIDYERDYGFDYFGFKTLERSYLLKTGGKAVERPQHMWMRVALGIHSTDIKDAIETYDLLSKKYFCHATPTLFNAGTRCQQFASCFLLAMQDDSIEGIYNTLKQSALISKYSGGIGIHIHNVRSTNSLIRGTNGKSTGIIPMLRVFNDTARYVNQCFAPETIVYGNIGPIRVDQVRPHDQLMTIDGTLKRVNQVIVNQVQKQILNIQVDGSLDPVRVTPEHQIYTMYQGKIEYVNAGDLTLNHYVSYPIPKVGGGVGGVGTGGAGEAGVVGDEAYYTFYGLMLAFGSASFPVCCPTPAPLWTLIIPAASVAALEFMKSYMHMHKIRYEAVYESHQTTIRFIITTNHRLYFPTTIRNFVATIMTGGGGGGTGVARLIETLDIHGYTSKELGDILALRYLALMSGRVRAAVFDVEKGAFALGKPISNQFVHNGLIWVKINSISTELYEGAVYDFNMQDNHNYLTDMGIVHNSGKRNGSIAMYLEPWHADVFEFLDIRKNNGADEIRSRDLFSALWIPDLFMERVEAGGMWSLMCPDECPGLSDCYGDEFKALYTKYEAEGRFRQQVPAKDLWFAILVAQIETGTPYMVYKDAANYKTNQKNIGIIKSSNLCSEILEVSTADETATCNLASICLPTYLETDVEGVKRFNFDKLHKYIGVVVKNINKIIDRNMYPTPETRRSNLLHRPIGIGVQGMNDVFMMMRMPFESAEAAALNREIFECMYHGALEASMELSRRRAAMIAEGGHEDHVKLSVEEANIEKPEWRGAYSSFPGSPASEGKLQFDLWADYPSVSPQPIRHSGRYDWDALKEKIKAHGLRNSLLLAPMPTASTSQIMGFTESFEPPTSNFYQRRTLAGEFVICSKYLIADLIRLGIWNIDMKNKILAGNGSIQHIAEIPDELKALYKTVWEIKQKALIDMSAGRGVYVDQSQSLNLFMEDPNLKKLTNMHFYAWKAGLKTGIYYLRSRPRAQTAAYSLDPNLVNEYQSQKGLSNAGQTAVLACSRDNPNCEMCSS